MSSHKGFTFLDNLICITYNDTNCCAEQKPLSHEICINALIIVIKTLGKYPQSYIHIYDDTFSRKRDSNEKGTYIITNIVLNMINMNSPFLK